MALIDTSPVDFLKTINRHTKVPLDLEGFVFSPVYPEDNGRDTRLRLTARDGYQYRGSEILRYHRLDLAYLDTLLFTTPQLYPRDDRLYSILDEFADGVGIRLTQDDVFDAGVVERDGTFTVELKAKPGSYRWHGQYLLRFNNLPRLSSIIDYDHITW